MKVSWRALKRPDSLAFWSLGRPGVKCLQSPASEGPAGIVRVPSKHSLGFVVFSPTHISIIHPIKAHKTQIKWFLLAREQVFGKQSQARRPRAPRRPRVCARSAVVTSESPLCWRCPCAISPTAPKPHRDFYCPFYIVTREPQMLVVITLKY